MSQSDNELEPRLDDLASNVGDDTSVARVVKGMHRTRSIRRRVRIATLGTTAIAIAAVAALTVSQQPGSTTDNPTAQSSLSRTPVSPRDSIGIVEPGEPCAGAKHASTIAELDSSVPVWAPTGGELTDAWTCGDTPVLLYGGIQITYEPGWNGVDIPKKFAELAKDYGGSVETVLDRPAWVHQATTEGPRNSVSVVVSDTLVRITAKKDVRIEDLVELANTVQLPKESSN